MDIELENALLEAIWISRFNEDKTALTSVLTPKEAIQICEDIVLELDKSGYKIIKNNNL